MNNRKENSMALFEIAGGNRIAEGGMGGFMVNGKKVLLTKLKGQYYAIDAACPHMGGDLSGGTVEGKYVTCPRHGHKIDVTTGSHGGGFRLPFTKLQGEKAGSYRIIVEDGKVKIELP
jgi:3-phenylpropionate/trans-cinnamate dioxygenase ferredoxin component